MVQSLVYETNPNKMKVSVVRRSKTENPPHGDLVLSGVSIFASPNLDNILGLKFDSKLTLEDHVRGIVSLVSQRIGILRLVRRLLFLRPPGVHGGQALP